MKSNIYTLRQPFTKAMIFIFLILVNLPLLAQVEVRFGNPPGTASQRQPFSDSLKYSRSVALYAGNLANVNGLITRLDWNVTKKETSGLKDYEVTIWLKETSDVSITNTSWDALMGTDTVRVYHHTIKFDATGWKKLLLDSIFNKSNTSKKNILVFIQKYNASPAAIADRPAFSYTPTTGTNMHASLVSNNITPPPPLPLLTLDDKRPDINFVLAVNPGNFSITDSTYTSLALNWTKNSKPDPFIILRSSSANLGSMPQGTATSYVVGNQVANGVVVYKGADTTYTDPLLNSGTTYYYKNFSYFSDNTSGSAQYYYSSGVTADGITKKASLTISYSSDFTKDKDTICASNTDSIPVYGLAVGGYAFSWYSSMNDSVHMTIITGATSANYLIRPVASDTATYYYCRHATKGSEVVVSNKVILKKIPVSIGGSISGSIDTSACLGSPITLTLKDYTGKVLYWMRQKAGVGYAKILKTQAILSDTLNVSGIWKYYAVVQSGICDSAASSEFNILVKAKPVLTATVSKDPICSGERTKVTLTAAGTGVQYHWKRDNVDKVSGPAATGISNTIDTTFTSSSQSNVKVTFTTWVILDQCVSDTVKPTVTVKPAPLLNKIVGDSIVCSALQVYDLNVIAGSKYQWTISPTTLGTAVGKTDTTSSVNVQWNPVTSPTTGSLTGTVTNRSSGCSASDKINIVVSTGVAPGPEQLVRKLPAVQGELFLFCKNFINQNAANYNYTWGYDSLGVESKPITDYQDKYFCLFKGYDPTKGYKYFVKMNDKTSGKACFTKTYYTPLPTELAPQNDFSIYPNPNAGTFKLEIDYETLGSFELSLYDILGHECARLPLTKSLRTESFQISVSSLMRGTYVAMIKFPDGNQLIKKMVIY